MKAQRVAEGAVTSRPAVSSPARGRPAGRGNGFAQARLASEAPAPQAPGPTLDTAAGERAATPDHATPTRDTAPAGGAARRQAGQAIDAAQSASLLAQVRATPRGATLLQELAAAGAEPTLSWSGQGSYMLGGDVFLDVELEGSDLVEVLVHELQHVANAKAGRTGDIATQDRATYVDRMLSDESQAEATRLVAALQSSAPTGVARAFLSSLATTEPGTFRAVRDRHPDTDWAHVEALALAYTRAEFETTLRTSTTGELYPDYYGAGWDSARGGGKS
jgi:hypothetical protein